MRRRAPLLLLVLGACGADAQLRVSIAPSLIFPRGLLDSVTKVTVRVYDPADGLDCDPTTGKLTSDASPFLTKELGTSLAGGPCPSGGKFCGELVIPKAAGRERIFQAQAATDANVDFAHGCAKAVVDQDALPLKILMIRNVPAAVCGNGTIEATEQCEPPDPTCDASCHTKEILVSNGAGAPSDKTNPFFLWPAAGPLVAFFGDKEVSQNNSHGEIQMRVMSDAFGTNPSFSTEMLMPNDPTTTQPVPGTRQLPVATFVNGKYYVAFDDDGSTNTSDIHMRSMDTSFVADQGSTAPLGINGDCPGIAGELGTQTKPSLATGPGGGIYVAWEYVEAQKIVGRLFTPSGTSGSCGAQVELSTGTGNHDVRIAASSTGWVVVWENGGDIKMRALDATATAGPEQIVNENTAGTQDHPSVAALPDGRFAIAWADHQAAQIVAQRFDAKGAKIPGDQTTGVSSGAGDKATPAIVGMNAASGSFVVAWVDGPTGHVHARLLGGSSGFLFNNVDGQPTDFQASIADGHSRANPTVAVGGSGPFIAIGWEDAAAGIVGRRFPIPVAQ